MKLDKAAKKDLYYTRDHEWVDFQGTIAYTGVCSFKLLGFKAIHQLNIAASAGFLKQGELIATIKYNEYRIDACMPVDGKIVELNEALVAGDWNQLLMHAESSSWIARIVPAQPYERKGLLLPKEYQFKQKR